MLLNIKEPTGVMAAANLFVVLHVAAAWQVRCLWGMGGLLFVWVLRHVAAAWQVRC